MAGSFWKIDKHLKFFYIFLFLYFVILGLRDVLLNKIFSIYVKHFVYKTCKGLISACFDSFSALAYYHV